jgi:uncharacterized membrane protein
LNHQTDIKQLKNNFLDTFTLFLKQLKVPVTESSALEYLETHPDEGSMLAYSDALNHFKIENAAVRITQEDLTSLPTPFVAFSQIHGGTFSMVKNLTENTIEWFDTQKGWVKDKLENFTKTWSGVVLLAETDEKSGEKNYTTKRRDEILRNIRIPVAVSLIAFIFLYFIINAPLVSTPTFILLGLKAIGMVISTLLFVKSIDNANSLVNKLCNSGSKISCQSILDSPAAKITPWFSWSDAGFIYFFGSFLGLSISIYKLGHLSTYWTLQLFFCSLALLFSSYSLYYQAIKAKMWCTLCLGVVTVFFLEVVLIFSTYTFEHFQTNLFAFLNCLVGFLPPIAFLLLYKTTALKAQERKVLKRELSKLKSNPQIFEALMASQRKMPEIPADMRIITIGNKNAENTITMVSNPLCSPCASIHERIGKLVSENDNLKCQIIFLSSTDENNSGGKFVRKLFSLPVDLIANGLHNWFIENDKNFEKWDKSYLEINLIMDAFEMQNKHNKWVKQAEVKGTPTLFINNSLLPDTLKIEEIINLIHL